MTSQTPPRTLLAGGHVITADPSRPDEFVGDVLIEGDRIAQVSPHIEVDAASTRVVDVAGKIVMPGMVDTHRHTWQAPLRMAGADWTIAQYGAAMWYHFGPHYTADDTYTALQLGIAEALDAGITQLLDWNHGISSPEHADATVAAHRASGARIIFGYGQSASVWNERA